MASVSEQQAAQCASQPQDLCFGGLAESLERKIAEQMKNAGTQHAHAKTNTPFGVKALQGTRPNMEDAYSVQMTPPPATSSGTAATAAAAGAAPGAGSLAAGAEQAQQGPGISPPQQQNLNGPSPEATVPVEGEDAANIPAPLLPEDLAVLSVFDGHGGNEVAEHCRESLHRHFAHILADSRATDDDDSCDDEAPPTRQQQHKKKTHYHHNIIAEALRQSFLCTDQELKGTEAGDYVGATAVVAVVGKCHIIIAHAGDSRAVIQRGGKAESLTRDHKPDRADEAARIKAAGGRVVFSNGGHRVMGMLAMSRAIGDHFLRPYVIADPEVVCVERTPHDEVLVLATDGLWDVFSCKEATTLAIRCIGRSKERGMSRHGACRVAASVLTKVALERGSRDNITVIVVDIAVQKQQQQQQHHQHQHPNPPQQVVQQTQAQQQVDLALNPLHKQQLQKQQQTHLLEQVKQQLQQTQTQPAEEQAQPHATFHPPPHTPTTQVQEHYPLQQQRQQQKAEPPSTQGSSIGHISSSSGGTPKVPSQQQGPDAAPPLPHHLSHHHHHQQHPQQHLNGNAHTSAPVSVTPGSSATPTPPHFAPTSLAPTPPPLAPTAPPASSATPPPPPTQSNITLPPPPRTQLPDALLSHQQIGSQLHQQQQQQQQQHMEVPPFHVSNRSISFHYPQHQQQHVHHNYHHQPHLHTLGSCSHTTSSSSLCSHTGRACL
ncbi:phosphatase 2C-like domain-containing protein [Dunaliella salina]|uniref:protein-serine/threonine phosphatase n=1 Tax=Dunaliella salina TaxID=3046 RepID=A0ABQ7G5N2_DUNSA|nr:phosphatase 2C-like domain-containing protein [Dunaliella salina]|eukprot:KAF5829921.1 phosphatase 2C-like domain-containing protein [Dunaliella salina]